VLSVYVCERERERERESTNKREEPETTTYLHLLLLLPVLLSMPMERDLIACRRLFVCVVVDKNNETIDHGLGRAVVEKHRERESGG
jgi:hypothetical protein